MRTLMTALLLISVCGGAALAAPAGAAGDTRTWLRHVIPLPKEVGFEGVVRLPPSDVVVELVGRPGDVEAQAADLVRRELGEPGPNPRWKIVLGRCSRGGRLEGARVPGAERLANLKNADQAYAIAPVDQRLILTGLTERGVYYAALTLSQLLAARRTADSVTVPLLRVVDWPDLAERGEWGGNAPADAAWMSAHKLNLVEVHASVSVDKDGVGHAVLKQELIEQGRLCALKMVPIIHHLDQLHGTGLLRPFPELKGVGAKAYATDSLQTLCFSKPAATKLLTDWMTELAQQPHVTDLCVWLSEDPGQCGCEECLKSNQFVLEARACIAAWRAACRVNRDLKLRLLLTQGTYKDNDKVLAEAPPEVNISYYDGGRTYDSSRNPMIYPLLADFAKQGRWLGVYPQITAAWRIVCPWSGPQFIKFRMTEFVDKGLSNLCAYATPNNRLYDFNVTAAAEWSWNAHGRDEREFATAWATCRGVKDPEQAAEWALTLGDVGWDVYGSGVPYPHFFGTAGRMVRDRAKPVWGKGLYRYFDTEARLQHDLAACRKAEQLAAALDFPEIAAETRVIAGYLEMLHTLYDITSFVSRTMPPTEADRMTLQRNLTAFSAAGAQTSEGLRAWADVCLPGSGGARLGDTIQVTEQTVTEVATALAPFGVRTPLIAFMTKPSASSGR